MEFLDNATIWVAISFILFVLLILKPLLRSSNQMLYEKQKMIEDKINNAKKIRDESKKVLENFKKEKSIVDKKVVEMVDNAKKESLEIQNRMKKNLSDTIKKKERNCEERINQTKLKIEEEISREIIIAAAKVTKQRILKDLSEKKDEEIIKKSILNVDLKLNK